MASMKQGEDLKIFWLKNDGKLPYNYENSLFGCMDVVAYEAYIEGEKTKFFRLSWLLKKQYAAMLFEQI
jgi:hypothetical protein